MLSIFVIGEGIRKVKKNSVYGKHKVEKFLNYIGKHRDEKKTSSELQRKTKVFNTDIYWRTWPVRERASSFRMVIKKTFLMMRIHTHYFRFLFRITHLYYVVFQNAIMSWHVAIFSNSFMPYYDWLSSIFNFLKCDTILQRKYIKESYELLNYTTIPCSLSRDNRNSTDIAQVLRTQKKVLPNIKESAWL